MSTWPHVVAVLTQGGASQDSHAVFPKVDVDQHRASSRPTLLVVKESSVAYIVRGADPGALVATRASAAKLLL